ncbi:uncharacterized protein LOC109606334 isoform X3 [Aethina tumida]|uniref:uncharacterized protein LOC109606334 isoform X3 n=1 Tax=Aethina tumida TaxID=116153 RepID=UPI00214954F6|nr:uncharacterized protein LOC109606334 isoform X3 [Aethina tumida]
MVELRYVDLLRIGCNKEEAEMTLRVYDDLCNGKKYSDIAIEHKTGFGPFLYGAKTGADLAECFVPLLTGQIKFSLQTQEILKEHENYASVHMVIVAPDKISYHEISSNLVDLKKRQAEDIAKHKRNLISLELKKHVKYLEQLDKIRKLKKMSH